MDSKKSKEVKSSSTAVQLLRKSLDRFLAKDMKGWSELCHENVVAEFPFAPEGSPGNVISNGNPYEMRYATFVTFHDGLIVNYREYWNPMVFLAAMAGTRFDQDDSAK